MILSVIMPVYNEKNTLLEILGKVRNVPITKEIIIVDDGSVDGTRDILNKLRGERDLKVIFHEKKTGKRGCHQNRVAVCRRRRDCHTRRRFGV